MKNTMTVTIPERQQHEGFHLATYQISKLCPVCGRARGVVFGGFSFDGSQRINVDCWNNPCGHVDSFGKVREEGKKVNYVPPTEYDKIREPELPNRLKRLLAGRFKYRHGYTSPFGEEWEIYRLWFGFILVPHSSVEYKGVENQKEVRERVTQLNELFRKSTKNA